MKGRWVVRRKAVTLSDLRVAGLLGVECEAKLGHRSKIGFLS